ncbi:MAG: hypothetical protein M1820_000872 [Bogoriella megaspora]|nr:MAG: hypothetical protein M1820_000872 [Bogoriella megaspora]
MRTHTNPHEAGMNSSERHHKLIRHTYSKKYKQSKVGIPESSRLDVGREPKPNDISSENPLSETSTTSRNVNSKSSLNESNVYQTLQGEKSFTTPKQPVPNKSRRELPIDSLTVVPSRGFLEYTGYDNENCIYGVDDGDGTPLDRISTATSTMPQRGPVRSPLSEIKKNIKLPLRRQSKATNVSHFKILPAQNSSKQRLSYRAETSDGFKGSELFVLPKNPRRVRAYKSKFTTLKATTGVLTIVAKGSGVAPPEFSCGTHGSKNRDLQPTRHPSTKPFLAETVHPGGLRVQNYEEEEIERHLRSIKAPSGSQRTTQSAGWHSEQNSRDVFSGSDHNNDDVEQDLSDDGSYLPKATAALMADNLEDIPGPENPARTLTEASQAVVSLNGVGYHGRPSYPVKQRKKAVEDQILEDEQRSIADKQDNPSQKFQVGHAPVLWDSARAWMEVQEDIIDVPASRSHEVIKQHQGRLSTNALAIDTRAQPNYLDPAERRQQYTSQTKAFSHGNAKSWTHVPEVDVEVPRTSSAVDFVPESSIVHRANMGVTHELKSD